MQSPQNSVVGEAGQLVDLFQVITESSVLVAAVIRTGGLIPEASRVHS